NVVVILLERGRSQDERDLGAVLGRKTDLQQVTVRSVPELPFDLSGDRVAVGDDGPAVHGDLFLASVMDGDLARPPLDRIEQRRLQNRSRMPEACRHKVARKVTRLAVVVTAKPFALAPELDPALLPVVVRARTERDEPAVAPQLLRVVPEPEHRDRQPGDGDLHAAAHDEAVLAGRAEIEGQGSDVVAAAQ